MCCATEGELQTRAEQVEKGMRYCVRSSWLPAAPWWEFLSQKDIATLTRKWFCSTKYWWIGKHICCFIFVLIAYCTRTANNDAVSSWCIFQKAFPVNGKFQDLNSSATFKPTRIFTNEFGTQIWIYKYKKVVEDAHEWVIYTITSHIARLEKRAQFYNNQLLDLTVKNYY